MSFKLGDRVKHGGCVIQQKRDYWNGCGSYTQKTRAREWLDQAIAERGTITAILEGDPSRGVSPGVEVKWDNGSISRCLPYRVALADN